MKYHFSSCGVALPLLEELGTENLLMSFAVDAKQCGELSSQNVIIDSGAFSVWNKGEEIDIDDYLKFCLNKSKEYTFVNLDVIPPRGSSKKDIEKCIEQGYENYIYLNDKLPNVMPVYHSGENLSWMKKYMDHTDYIGVGFGNNRHEKDRRVFLNEVFSITQTEHKVHGLGYSSFEGLTIFPFYSVDSISYKGFNVRGDRFLVSQDLWFLFRESIKTFLKLERDITKIWEHRGVFWDKK